MGDFPAILREGVIITCGFPAYFLIIRIYSQIIAGQSFDPNDFPGSFGNKCAILIGIVNMRFIRLSYQSSAELSVSGIQITMRSLCGHQCPIPLRPTHHWRIWIKSIGTHRSMSPNDVVLAGERGQLRICCISILTFWSLAKWQMCL